MTDRRPTRLDSTRWIKHSGRGQAGRADLAGFISASPSPSIHAACLKHPILFSRLVAFPLLVDCCLLRAVVWKSTGQYGMDDGFVQYSRQVRVRIINSFLTSRHLSSSFTYIDIYPN